MSNNPSKYSPDVILVDSNDVEKGTMEKMEAHRKGLLHRAFSIFIFNTQGELLIQQRALSKYHSGGLLTNTCCSHPFPGEETMEAATRRLKEEMGMECEMKEVFSFEYRAELDKGLTEHELDHVLFGTSDLKPEVNPEEVESYHYQSLKELEQDIYIRPKIYTEWFKVCFEEVKSYRHYYK